MLLNQGAVLGNRYEIIEKVGSGGMAIVYKAKDLKLSRTIAVKILREEFSFDEEFVERFRVEAQAAAALLNPNIVNVYDVGQDEDVHYIVMEYFEGYTLKDLIREKAPFDQKTAIGVAMQIGNALSTAHKNGVIHRDIKPQNILVSSDGRIKVADFGIARAASSKTVASTSSIIGSVHYFSPEQAKGGYIDSRTDIYSLGIVIYEMITGKMPYDGDTSVTVALKHINEQLPQISDFNSTITESLKAIVLKCTQKSPDDRYNNVDLLVKDLQRALSESKDFINTEDNMTTFTKRFSEDEVNEINKSKLNSETQKSKVKPALGNSDNVKNPKSGFSDRTLILSAIGTAFVLIIIISILGYNFLLNNDNAKASTMVSLTGISIDYAKEKAKDLGVEVNVIEEYDNSIEKNIVKSQDIQEGTKIKNGEVVTLVVSLGHQLYEMPTLLKEDEYNIDNILDDMPFTLDDIEYVNSDTIPIGLVVSQFPNPGEMIPQGSEIRVSVSKGPANRELTVPELVGISEKEARNAILNAGFEIGAVSKSASTRYAAGLVTAQSYEKDKKIKTTGTITIDIVISSGPPQNSENSQQEDDAPKTGSKSYIIIPSEMPDPGSEVLVKLVFISSDNAQNISLYEKKATAEEFPLDVTVSGTGKGDIQLYIGNKYEWRDEVDFDGGN